jgi:hypothetical protein
MICNETPTDHPLQVHHDADGSSDAFCFNRCVPNLGNKRIALEKTEWCDDCLQQVFRDAKLDGIDNCINPYSLHGSSFQLCLLCVCKREENFDLTSGYSCLADEVDKTGEGLPERTL